MLIAIKKPNLDQFIVTNIHKPLYYGWRISNNGRVAVSLTTRYYCDGIAITNEPESIRNYCTYQCFILIDDVYVYVGESQILNGNLYYLFSQTENTFQSLPSDMVKIIRNELQTASVSL